VQLTNSSETWSPCKAQAIGWPLLTGNICWSCIIIIVVKLLLVAAIAHTKGSQNIYIAIPECTDQRNPSPQLISNTPVDSREFPTALMTKRHTEIHRKNECKLTTYSPSTINTQTTALQQAASATPVQLPLPHSDSRVCSLPGSLRFHSRISRGSQIQASDRDQRNPSDQWEHRLHCHNPLELRDTPSTLHRQESLLWMLVK
jgi:hypothetical protein